MSDELDNRRVLNRFYAHPERANLLGEVHARPFVPLSGCWDITQFVFMLDQHASGKTDVESLNALLCAQGGTGADQNARFLRIPLGRQFLRWERHSEFSSWAVETPLPCSAECRPLFQPIEKNLLSPDNFEQPGPLVSAVRLVVIQGAKVDLEEHVGFFDPASLSVSRVAHGRATIATDFRIDCEGMIRILVLDHGLAPAELGAVVQRAIEVETYRMLAMLGLSEARDQEPLVSRIETELVKVTRRMQVSVRTDTSSLSSHEALLAELTKLAVDLEANAVACLYRFGASRAYHDIVSRRLDVLGEQVATGYGTIGRFLNRRLAPAMQTCASLEQRHATLSVKLARATSLLRARVEVGLEKQNTDLLLSMNKRVRSQLQLQQTVEGLSVAAISYYVVSLIGAVFKGINIPGYTIDPAVAMAVSVPVVVCSLWYIVRRIRIKHTLDEGNSAD